MFLVVRKLFVLALQVIFFYMFASFSCMIRTKKCTHIFLSYKNVSCVLSVWKETNCEWRKIYIFF